MYLSKSILFYSILNLTDIPNSLEWNNFRKSIKKKYLQLHTFLLNRHDIWSFTEGSLFNNEKLNIIQ